MNIHGGRGVFEYLKVLSKLGQFFEQIVLNFKSEKTENFQNSRKKFLQNSTYFNSCLVNIAKS